jgi:hypothetical protein
MDIRRNKAIDLFIVLLLCLILVSAFMLGSLTSVKHVLHPCFSSNCRICDLLLITDRALKLLFLTLSLMGIASLAGGQPLLAGGSFCEHNKCYATLVRLKIRLNH